MFGAADCQFRGRNNKKKMMPHRQHAHSVGNSVKLENEVITKIGSYYFRCGMRSNAGRRSSGRSRHERQTRRTCLARTDHTRRQAELMNECFLCSRAAETDRPTDRKCGVSNGFDVWFIIKQRSKRGLRVRTVSRRRIRNL